MESRPVQVDINEEIQTESRQVQADIKLTGKTIIIRPGSRWDSPVDQRKILKRSSGVISFVDSVENEEDNSTQNNSSECIELKNAETSDNLNIQSESVDSKYGDNIEPADSAPADVEGQVFRTDLFTPDLKESTETENIDDSTSEIDKDSDDPNTNDYYALMHKKYKKLSSLTHLRTDSDTSDDNSQCETDSGSSDIPIVLTRRSTSGFLTLKAEVPHYRQGHRSRRDQSKEEPAEEAVSENESETFLGFIWKVWQNNVVIPLLKAVGMEDLPEEVDLGPYMTNVFVARSTFNEHALGTSKDNATDQQNQPKGKSARPGRGGTSASAQHGTSASAQLGATAQHGTSTENPTPPQWDWNAYVKTGFFTDKIRRVDYVLVVRNAQGGAGEEKVKADYLGYLVKLGVQIEAERGAMYTQFNFIKLHGTDKFFSAYVEDLDVLKHFRDPHLQVMNNEKERDILLTVRQQYKLPLQLSNMDRSYIMSIVLQHATFGNYKNYYGLQSLIDNGIIVDGYALHDGPYPVERDQPMNPNCRQFLYKNWAQMKNVFSHHPCHVINEYFGPQIAFYFAFYNLYIKVLLLVSLWGIFMTGVYLVKDREYMQQLREIMCMTGKHFEPSVYHMWRWYNIMDKTYSETLPSILLKGMYNIVDELKVINKSSTELWYNIHTGMRVCAECEGEGDPLMCPTYQPHTLCFDMLLMKLFDSPYIIVYSAGILCLGFLFFHAWKRTEKHYRWMWEESYWPLPDRHEYNSKKCIGFAVQLLSEILLPFFALFVSIFVMYCGFILLYGTVRKQSVEEYIQPEQFKPEHVKVSILQPIINREKEYGLFFLQGFVVQLVLIIFEKILHVISCWLTRAENHKYHDGFYLALCKRYVLISFTMLSPLVIYFGWIKGAFYITPMGAFDGILNFTSPWFNYSVNLTDKLSAKHIRKLLTWNCGLFSCFRQGTVMFVATVALISLARIIDSLKYLFSSRKQQRGNEIPAWEREYSLRPVSEVDMAAEYNALFRQLALVFMFAPFFPLAPILVLLANLIHIRTKAHSYVVHSRRVVLYKATGIGPWNGVLSALRYISVYFHAISIARTEIFKKYLFYKEKVFKASNDSNFVKLSESYQKFASFMMSAGYTFNNVKKNFPRYYEENENRFGDYNNTHEKCYAFYYYPGISDAEVVDYGATCRFDGFYADRGPLDLPWPWQTSYIEDLNNRTTSVPTHVHYRLLYYKAVFVLLYTALMWSVCLLLHWRSLPDPAEEREWQLKLLRQEAELPPDAPRAARGSATRHSRL